MVVRDGNQGDVEAGATMMSLARRRASRNKPGRLAERPVVEGVSGGVSDGVGKMSLQSRRRSCWHFLSVIR